MSTQTQRRGQANGRAKNPPRKVEVSADALVEAAAYEAEIAEKAREVWATVAPEDENAALEAVLTLGLFRKLRPLLRLPIPEGFIQEVSAGDGKPYPSKGIRSMQVQIDRLDNVLGEGNWDWHTEYLNDAGTLAEVEVWVIGGEDNGKLFSRKARGGMDRGSTLGNTFKGTETNAAKLAFARLGPGHEVYIGLTDLDPDVNEQEAQARAGDSSPQLPADDKLPDEFVAMLGEKVDKAGLSQTLPVKLRSFGVEAMKDLTVEQGRALWAWTEKPNG